MDYFHYQDNELYVENFPITELAREWGTPLYVYSAAALEHNFQVFDQAFDTQAHLICYAVKANSNLAILNLLAQQGCGFDIVSGGELHRVLRAGADAKKIIFSGVGKTADELKQALSAQIGCFNIESAAEMELLQSLAQEMGAKANIAIRVNPDINPETHPYISTGLKESKFGVALKDAIPLYLKAKQSSHLEIRGIACHIGSQLTSLSPFLAALKTLESCADELEGLGIPIAHLDLGGGLGVSYSQETPPLPQEYVDAILKHLSNPKRKIILAPGRAIVADAGVLVSKVLYLKQNQDRHFAIVDAAMNDLIRPALYEAYQTIIPVINRGESSILYDVVGPVCESGDFLGKQRLLNLKENDLLAVRSAGAYGFAMSSNYNSRPRAAEILVHHHQAYIVRQRETYEDLWMKESIPR
jgi:diaminopimelate decarboxylase